MIILNEVTVILSNDSTISVNVTIVAINEEEIDGVLVAVDDGTSTMIENRNTEQ